MEFELEDRSLCNILVAGVTGSGKSALINTLINERLQEGCDISSVNTTEIVPKTCNLNGTNCMIWDTPGLLSGSNNKEHHLMEIQEKISCQDLVIFCLKCTDTRFTEESPGVVAMELLTSKLGKTIWENAIIALTFANNLEIQRPQWKRFTFEQKQEAFKNEVQQWESCVRKCLISSIGVKRRSAEKILFIPVGYYDNLQLLDIPNWVVAFKSLCVEKLNKPKKIVKKDKTGAAVIGGLIGFGFGCTGLVVAPLIVITLPVCIAIGVYFGRKSHALEKFNFSRLTGTQIARCTCGEHKYRTVVAPETEL
ncbi:uncharacterized protein LOC135340422 [Halichondria panicea]|uniref:uncharacterized protein LOC135340422 n=1 Tax=Halichondria panicea TaxID=6063 RepID=UPI00312B7620